MRKSIKLPPLLSILSNPACRVGLGTGTTATVFLDLLADRVRAGLDIVGVPTSERTRARAEQLGIPLTTLDEHPVLDLTVDGADEVTPDLNLIKGGGGALLHEKIIAAASSRVIIIADESKWVALLGAFPLPLEVTPFGLRATRRSIESVAAAAGAPGPTTVRRTKEGHIFVTEGGHLIVDAALTQIIEPKVLAQSLSTIPGVMEHGLFLGLAHLAIIAGSDGVRFIERT